MIEHELKSHWQGVGGLQKGLQGIDGASGEFVFRLEHGHQLGRHGEPVRETSVATGSSASEQDAFFVPYRGSYFFQMIDGSQAMPPTEQA
jgi:hypothetical protein